MKTTEQGSASTALEDEAAVLRMLQEEAKQMEKDSRECPVPKPKAWLGRVLAFEHKGANG